MTAREVEKPAFKVPKVLADTLEANGFSVDDVPRSAVIELTGDLGGKGWWIGVDIFIRDVDGRRVAAMRGDVLSERKYFPLVGELVELNDDE